MEEEEEKFPGEEVDEEFGEARAEGDGVFYKAAGEDEAVGVEAGAGRRRRGGG